MRFGLRNTGYVLLLALILAPAWCGSLHSLGWPQRDSRDLVVRDGAVYEYRQGPGGAPALVERDLRWAVPVPDAPGLPNLFRVTPDLYRGAQPTEEGFRTLSRMGVKTVINLRSAHTDRGLMEGAGARMNYYEIRFETEKPSTEQVAALLMILRERDKLPAFIHCRRGSDRTGMMTAAYRVVAQGWSKDQALAEMTRGGFGYNSFWKNLTEFVRRMDAGTLARASGWPDPEPELRLSDSLVR